MLFDGDILVTKTKGHTAIVCSGNPRIKVEEKPTEEPNNSVKDIIATQKAKAKNTSLAGKYITTSNVYLRDGAGKENKFYCVVPSGTVVSMYGYFTKKDFTDWYYVQAVVDGIRYTGFVCSLYLKKR